MLADLSKVIHITFDLKKKPTDMFHKIRNLQRTCTLKILRQYSELHQDVAAEVPTSPQSLKDMFQPRIEHLQGTYTASEKNQNLRSREML
jgi:preprotein translocase subunit SecB